MARYLDVVFTGWRLCSEFGLTAEQVEGWAEIRRLNTRARSAWERGNNSGDSAYLERMDAVADRAWTRAKAIATRYNWTLRQPGLFWQIINAKGVEIR